MARRDIVVIGASAGGVEPLRTIASQLNPDLPASIFVVLHVPSERPSTLAEILDRSGPLPAVEGCDGEPVEKGRIYVAAPDHHLLVDDGRLRKRGSRRLPV